MMVKPYGLLDFAKTPGGQGLLAAVAGGLAGARRGEPINSIGRGGLAGIAGYSNALQTQGQQELRDMQSQALRDQLDKRKRIKEIMASNGAPTPAPSTSALPSVSLVPSSVPRIGDTGGQAPAQPAVPAHIRYQQQADALMQAGLLEEANRLYGIANQYKPKINSQKAMRTADGKIVMANVFDDGRTEAVEGFSPAEKLNFQNTGGTTVALDPYTGKPVNEIKNTQSPDSIANNAIAIRGQNMVDARQREAVQMKRNDDSKPLPVAALKLQQEDLDAIGTAAGINADLAAVAQQIKDKKLSLSGLGNIFSSAINAAGFSTENSRNYASFRATLEKMRNDSLRLNKGVQTDGDAVRAWNELFDNINDEQVVLQRLEEIQRINERAVNLRKMNIDQVRANYGKSPLDTSEYQIQPPALGGKGSAPVVGSVIDGYRFRGGNPADKSNWEKQ